MTLSKLSTPNQLEPAGQPGDQSLSDQVNRFLANEEFSKAYPLICRMVEMDGAVVSTATTAGLLALTLKRPKEALAHFQSATRLDPDDYDAAHNLAVMYIQHELPDRALNVLSGLLEHNPNRADLHNDIGVVCLNMNQYERALECFKTAFQMNPDLREAKEAIAELEAREDIEIPITGNSSNNAKHISDGYDTSSLVDPSPEPTDVSVQAIDSGDKPIRGARIALLANHVTFLTEIESYLGRDNEVRLCEQPTPEQVNDLTEWADIAWFEWCDNLLIEASRQPRKARVLCRLHSYEAFTNMPSQVNWHRVDHLLFVNESVRQLFERHVTCTTPRSVIHNGVNLDKFTIPIGKEYGRKIASVGYINYSKNPTLLLYCFKKIHDYNPDYTLHIAGQFQDPRIELYFEHFLNENPLPVHFDGWVEDVPAWYADKDFVISTSLFESFHYSIAEGMASGVIPLIHNWLGAANLYPTDYLFADPDDCLSLIKRLESADFAELANLNREHIDRHFNQKDRCIDIAVLLGQIVADNNE